MKRSLVLIAWGMVWMSAIPLFADCPPCTHTHATQALEKVRTLRATCKGFEGLSYIACTQKPADTIICTYLRCEGAASAEGHTLQGMGCSSDEISEGLRSRLFDHAAP